MTKKETMLKELVTNLIKETYDSLQKEILENKFVEKFEKVEEIITEKNKYSISELIAKENQRQIRIIITSKETGSNSSYDVCVGKDDLEDVDFEDKNIKKFTKIWIERCKIFKMLIRKVNEEYKKIVEEEKTEIDNLIDEIINIDDRLEEKELRYNIKIITKTESLNCIVKDSDLELFEARMANDSKFIWLPTEGEKHFMNKNEILEIIYNK